MMASLSDGTLKQYTACFRKYWSFCQDENLNPFDFNMDAYLKFLTNNFNSGSSFSVLNSYRSALNLILGPISTENEKIINRFLKGIANLRPPNPKYSVTWDPDPLLTQLAKWYPLESLSFENLTYKLVTLMALTSASRVQTLSLIRIKDLVKSTNKIEIRVSGKTKTSAVGKSQPTLVFPFFRSKPELCVATTIEFYLTKTSSFRGEEASLILTHKKPFHAASSQTLSRWIKKTLYLVGVDTSIFSAHSVRHASTSAALRVGVSVEQIKNTAGWTPASKTFFNFYNRPLIQPNDVFAKAILARDACT